VPRPGYKERRLAIRKWLLSLRCDCITMVQPAESIKLAATPSGSRFAKSRSISDVSMLFTNLCGTCGQRLKLAELE
jgi:hypothetical protein